MIRPTLALLLSMLLLPATLHAKGAKWLTNYEEALEEAEKTGKPVVANFTGSDWCGYCIRLHKSVFSTSEFKKWADKNVVLLELDFPRGKKLSKELKAQNATLAQKYQIKGYPTVYILDSDGEKLGRTGYMDGGPDKWTANVDGMIGDYLDSKASIREKATTKVKKPAGPAAAKANPWAAAREKKIARLKADGYRDWTNASGKTIFAKYVAKKEGKVAFTLDSGKKVILELSQLSDTDQATIIAMP
jgi:protein disulfide-isomerase